MRSGRRLRRSPARCDHPLASGYSGWLEWSRWPSTRSSLSRRSATGAVAGFAVVAEHLLRLPRPTYLGRGSRRLSPAASLIEIIDAWLFQLGARKPSSRTLAAYRADVEGVARRIDTDGPAVLHLEDLTKPALRAAFASWASDHAAASVVRAHSAWSSLFDCPVVEDLLEGNPMAAIPKPRLARSAPKAIKAEDAAGRRLTTAATLDTASRAPWPERDLALVALFLVSGIR